MCDDWSAKDDSRTGGGECWRAKLVRMDHIRQAPNTKQEPYRQDHERQRRAHLTARSTDPSNARARYVFGTWQILESASNDLHLNTNVAQRFDECLQVG